MQSTATNQDEWEAGYRVGSSAGKLFRTKEIADEIEARLLEYGQLGIDHANDENAVHELESAVNELKNLLEWINKL